MWQKILKPVCKVINNGKHSKDLSDFYRIKIVNKTKSVIWLAKNKISDLPDIIPPNESVEIPLTELHELSFLPIRYRHTTI